MLIFQHNRLEFFDNYPKTDWFVIACQSIRSVLSHAEDILADQIMMEADVLCLTETCIEEELWPKEKNFTAFDIFTKSRRTSYDSESRCNRKSGGVAVLIKNAYLSAVENPMKIKNIELLSTIITSDYGDLIIVVLYKDHMGDN